MTSTDDRRYTYPELYVSGKGDSAWIISLDLESDECIERKMLAEYLSELCRHECSIDTPQGRQTIASELCGRIPTIQDVTLWSVLNSEQYIQSLRNKADFETQRRTLMRRANGGSHIMVGDGPEPSPDWERKYATFRNSIRISSLCQRADHLAWACIVLALIGAIVGLSARHWLMRPPPPIDPNGRMYVYSQEGGFANGYLPQWLVVDPVTAGSGRLDEMYGFARSPSGSLELWLRPGLASEGWLGVAFTRNAPDKLLKEPCIPLYLRDATSLHVEMKCVDPDEVAVQVGAAIRRDVDINRDSVRLGPTSFAVASDTNLAVLRVPIGFNKVYTPLYLGISLREQAIQQDVYRFEVVGAWYEFADGFVQRRRISHIANISLVVSALSWLVAVVSWAFACLRRLRLPPDWAARSKPLGLHLARFSELVIQLVCLVLVPTVLCFGCLAWIPAKPVSASIPSGSSLQPPDAAVPEIVPAAGHRRHYSTWREVQRYVAYSPSEYRPGVSPNATSLAADLSVLAPYFDGLVLYSTREWTGSLCRIAQEGGFALILGIWDPIDEEELDHAAQLATEYGDSVQGICVGNEGLRFDRYSLDQLQAALGTLRSKVSVPLTTSEPIVQYASPGLRSLPVDFHSPNIHLKIDENTGQFDSKVTWVFGRALSLEEETGKPVLIKETGVPTGPPPQYSLEAQTQFWKLMLEHQDEMRREDVYIAVFEAFDQSWKVNPSLALGIETMGSEPVELEAHWGFFQANREPKPVLKGIGLLHDTLQQSSSP